MVCQRIWGPITRLVRDPLKSPEQSERQIRPIWRSQSSNGILLHVRAPRAICMPPIYRYWYVYSRSIFRIQNSEYAFHFICVFSVDFQKHATSYSDACFWNSTENTHIKVECLFWILNSEHWLKIHIHRRSAYCNQDLYLSQLSQISADVQRMSATVQRMSAGVQRMSATVQRMSANFQNKAVSKYFWNMYQLMSAAVHVLRYVLSSGYQMRALHEFTNVSGSWLQ